MTLVKVGLDAGIGAEGDKVAGNDRGGGVEGKDEGDGAAEAGFGDDEGAEGAAITAHVTDRTRAEAAVVSAIQNNQIRRASGDDRDDRSLAIRFGRTKRTDFRADRGGGDEKSGHGEDVAHGVDY